MPYLSLLASHFPIRPLTIPAAELCRALITNPSRIVVVVVVVVVVFKIANTFEEMQTVQMFYLHIIHQL